LGGPVGARIGPGLYQISVTNQTNNCQSTGDVTLEFQRVPTSILEIIKQDQLICLPDGRIEVTSMEVDNVADYTFKWYSGAISATSLSDPSGVVINGPILSVTNFPSIGEGEYFVVGTRNGDPVRGSGCDTDPLTVELKDLSTNPQADISFTSNFACLPSLANGQIDAAALEADGSSDTYVFTWSFAGAALPAPATANSTAANSTITGAIEGTYVLNLLNNITGCSIETSVTVDQDLTISVPNIAELSKIETITCIGDGQASVVSVKIGDNLPVSGPSILPPSFNYEWFNGSTANPIAGATGITVTNLAAGKYLVRVTDNSTGCVSDESEIEITDEQIIFPSVDITQDFLQVVCTDGIGSAQLTALGGTTAGPFNYTWFNTLCGNDPAGCSGTGISNNETISSLDEGNYSVRAFDSGTGCSVSNFFIVKDDSKSFGPAIATGGEELTNCAPGLPNGSVSVRVINLSEFAIPNNQYPFPQYLFDAFIRGGSLAGEQAMPPNPTTGLPGTFITSGLQKATYDVRVRDVNTGCEVTASEEVKDDTVLPVVAVLEENPLTNCTPFIDNGQLSATADGGKVGGYTFDWFSSSPDVFIIQNNTLIGQTKGTYKVEVTNNFTSCKNQKTGTITDGRILPPSPNPLVLTHQTNCAPLMANGSATVTVKGKTVDFLFDWFEGTTDSGTADFTGIDYLDLESGDYAVVAQDLTTACRSKPALIKIDDRTKKFSVKMSAKAAFCADSGKPPIGFALAETVLDPGDTVSVLVDSVAWLDLTTNQIIPDLKGVQAFNLYPGRYRATVFNREQCNASAEVEVPTEIATFNGISKDNDGNNDFFIIDCITNFPNNNVKIFNRSGILVYEATSYNNADVRFEGIGVNGLYLQGRDLPDGTYFYIIDKRDGSKPVAGYIEITR